MSTGGTEEIRRSRLFPGCHAVVAHMPSKADARHLRHPNRFLLLLVETVDVRFRGPSDHLSRDIYAGGRIQLGFGSSASGAKDRGFFTE